MERLIFELNKQLNETFQRYLSSNKKSYLLTCFSIARQIGYYEGVQKDMTKRNIDAFAISSYKVECIKVKDGELIRVIQPKMFAKKESAMAFYNTLEVNPYVPCIVLIAKVYQECGERKITIDTCKYNSLFEKTKYIYEVV